MKIFITCEHANLLIPTEYEYLFADDSAKQILATHRGHDAGAREIAQYLESQAHFSIFADYSRLLIDINRSLHHPYVFSEFTKVLPKQTKQQIIEKYYLPYRQKVLEEIMTWLKLGEEVRHFSIHSFSPILNNEMRNADIGLLYDPTRLNERQLAITMKTLLQELRPSWRIRYNYPYLGKADGFVTYLRKQFPQNYLGIEIEVNQQLLTIESIEDISSIFAKVLFS